MLLVDDDLMIRGYVRTVLEEEDISVDLAEDSREALLMTRSTGAGFGSARHFFAGYGWPGGGDILAEAPTGALGAHIVISSAPDAGRRAVRMNAKAFLRNHLTWRNLVDAVARYTSDADAA